MQNERTSLDVIGVTPHGARLTTTAPSLLVTIESAVAEVQRGSETVLLDRSGVLVAPARARVVARAKTASCRLALVSFGEAAFAATVREHRRLGMRRDRFDGWLAHMAILPRTLWVHEIVHRYVFERVALEQHRSSAARFLETEILKEVYFLFRDRDEGADRGTNLRRHGPVVERALTHIETDLFGERSVPALAALVGASESTLLRAFRTELGETPGTYWRNRVLEEALALLRGGCSVAEVATRVGYPNPTVFTVAFKRRFHAVPSAFLPRVRLRRSPTA
jgi:AraC-like DNA-binding protein